MSISKYNNLTSTGKWGYPIYLCDCCPYGYHIDLDFVRYCETISKETDCSTGSIKRRKDRRKQRKSMEVLLGLTSVDEMRHVEPICPSIEVGNRLLRKRDSFDNIIDDFEKTFQVSKKLSDNLPDVTAVSDTRALSQISMEISPNIRGQMGMKKFVGRKFENPSEYCLLSPTTFKNIREQMALSLERTRQLEEEMKQLPQLKDRIALLMDENKLLLQKLRMQEHSERKTRSYNSLINSFDARYRSNSFSEIDVVNSSITGKQSSPIPRSTKDIGVTCSVLTRNVGVGPQIPHLKNASTEMTSDGNFVDKWFGEKLKFINDQYETEGKLDEQKNKISFTKGNQTQIINKHHQTTQTFEFLVPKRIINQQTQTTNKLSMADFGAQKSIEVHSVGVSNDKITDICCEKCIVAKIDVAVGTKTYNDFAPISLSSLSPSRSKSFNLGSDKLDLSVRKRSLGVQYQYKPECSTKSVQYESSNMSRSCQANPIKLTSRGSQYESRLVESGTQTDESSFIDTKTTSKKDKSCEAKENKPSTKSIGCNTIWDVSTATVCTTCQNRKKVLQNQKESDEKEEFRKKDVRSRDETVSLSKIPRLQLTPILKRQDTYTKISSPTDQENIGLSGLDLSVKSSTSTFTPFNKTDENYTIPEGSRNIQAQNEINKPTLIRSDTYECTSTATGTGFVSISQSKHREKVTPSKEMQGAMKVLNDSLQNHTRLQKNHKAINIIQQEWFKIAGLLTANPLDVEDYLDSFEDTSSLLLDYIVNMTDASGNTAMHYAVSHGNFDVVSILLDSKVCDINKPNKAGYTSVMLVSLADIRSETHAHVVKRLFQMADVNIRAKQHGQTALMLAVSHGRLDMVKMLLEAGADINIQDDDGSTALMCAAEHGHIEIVKHFLSQPDCDSTITDVDGSTALKIAMEAGHRPIGVLLYAHERSLAMAVGHKHKKKSTSPRPPSSPLSVRQSRSALNDVRSSK